MILYSISRNFECAFLKKTIKILYKIDWNNSKILILCIYVYQDSSFLTWLLIYQYVIKMMLRKRFCCLNLFYSHIYSWLKRHYMRTMWVKTLSFIKYKRISTSLYYTNNIVYIIQPWWIKNVKRYNNYFTLLYYRCM